MISKHEIFCKVIETGSFTRAAEQLGYSQSAVSQTVKTLENEMKTVLVYRKKDGISLTGDGKKFFPYIQAVAGAEEALEEKIREMEGLEDCTIRIGTFTSVSRNLLPQLMNQFKERYPCVHFVLSQGEYTGIANWIREGSVDFGFLSAEAVDGIEIRKLYTDRMMAVLPEGHPLGKEQTISIRQLARETFILLDEGAYSLPLEAFRRKGCEPDIEYKVYDDYSILAMVRQGLGVSMIYEKVLEGFEEGLTVLPLKEKVERTVAIGYRNWEIMPIAARRFVEFVLEQRHEK